MKNILGCFLEIPNVTDLIVAKKTDDMILFESFIMENPPTTTEFPESDEPYYTSLEYQLRHLLFKFEKGWIGSERQVIYSSDECISTIHFIFDGDKKVNRINVFQRSSNLLNLEDDVQFFNYFIKKYCDPNNVELTMFVSMPHILVGRDKKVED